MSVAVSHNPENDRFVRHSFLSISPTSTTVYQRTFDLQTCKYFVPTRINEETGEIDKIKPPTFEKHKGTLSDKARRNLNRSVYTLLSMVDKEILLSGAGKEKVTFATLTLPSPQIQKITETDIIYYATDKQIKHDCFNQLLTELKQTNKITLDTWVCEKQLNGSIHFHILFDSRIDYEFLRTRWNALINKFGFVDRYSEKMRKLTKQQYVTLRTKEYEKRVTKEDLQKINKAWDFGQKTNWTQPNSTDIQSLKDIENIASYISKYMSKGYGHTNDEMKNYISSLAGHVQISDYIAKKFYQIDGKIWSCSQVISKARKCTVEAEDYMLEDLKALQQSIENIKVFCEDRFTTVLHKFNHLFTYCKNIYTHYVAHIKKHADLHFMPALDKLYNDYFNSLLPDLFITETSQKTKKYFYQQIQFT